MPKVRFEPSGRTVETTDENETLYELAARAGIPLESVCGGRGICGRCRVIIATDVIPVTPEDKKCISEKDLERGVRLACRHKVDRDLVVEVPEECERTGQVILEKTHVRVNIDPAVKRVTLCVPPPSLDYPMADFERIKQVLSISRYRDLKIPLELLSELPGFLRKGEEIEIVLRNNEIIRLAANEDKRVYGVAIDVGTTTIVAYLMDLITGEEVAVKSDMNPQIRYGDDVISRITFTMETTNGLDLLRDLVIKCINDLIHACCSSVQISKEEVYEVVVVGNTAMHHMLFGLEMQSLVFAPHIPVVTAPIEQKAFDAGIDIWKEGYLYSLPNIAGFVGADHVGVLLAVGADRSDKVQMIIDIGTNGEISLVTPDGIASASCAAGPAFEGGNLAFGMRGAKGAIDHVHIRDDLEVEYSVIGNVKPRGICGSGVVDAIAEMIQLGIVDRSGRIVEEIDSPRIIVKDGESRFVIAYENETAVSEPIAITQNDVLQVQYAKAAMYAGAATLMKKMGLGEKDLDAILLAGAFGNYLDPASARTIGLFPEIPLDRIIGIGNAAGAGAKLALLNRELRRRANDIARKVRYIELAAQPDFEETFYSALYFPHLDPSRFPSVNSEIIRRSKGCFLKMKNRSTSKKEKVI
ncbi:MAG: ASKHA domain-containing protein [Methanomassiliicoccales archaeon]|jgi:uncharacterized 2Fe-2S/4Fe-4S cluster protein (DUF4445 family)|nr:ASKHA domain-containing protein [Methanomassiliicoccales archaeon]